MHNGCSHHPHSALNYLNERSVCSASPCSSCPAPSCSPLSVMLGVDRPTPANLGLAPVQRASWESCLRLGPNHHHSCQPTPNTTILIATWSLPTHFTSLAETIELEIGLERPVLGRSSISVQRVNGGWQSLETAVQPRANCDLLAASTAPGRGQVFRVCVFSSSNQDPGFVSVARARASTRA
eukprot:scpid58370/ scgid23334/ 